jgi:hypothetical protein
MGAVFSWLASFLSGPIIKGVIDGYKAKLAAENTSEKIAADLAARELAVQETEIQALAQLKIAEVGHPFEVEKLFAYVLLIYFAKVFLWDAAFHLGSSDAVKGATGEWAGWIMGFYFLKRGAENVIRILKR